MNETTFTFQVDEALKKEFTAAAKFRDRTGAQLLRDFMRNFVRKQQEATEHDVWFQRQVAAVGINRCRHRLACGDATEARAGQSGHRGAVESVKLVWTCSENAEEPQIYTNGHSCRFVVQIRNGVHAARQWLPVRE